MGGQSPKKWAIRRHIRFAHVTGAALLAIVGGGCGANAPEKEEAADAGAPVLGQGLPRPVDHPVADAISELQRAFVANDIPAVCKGITRQASRQAGEAGHGTPASCERNVRRLSGMIDKGGGWRHRGEPRVIAVETKKRKAVATVALDRHWKARVPMVRASSGKWMLSGFFGTPREQVPDVVEAIPENDFPPRGGEPLTVSRVDGSSCPALSEARYPKVSGGCTIKLATREAPLTILTALGTFEFARCSIAYVVRIDSAGRTFVEDFDVQGGPQSAACGDVNACYDLKRKAYAPWRGRIRSNGKDGFVHRTDMCLYTCVGIFIADLTVRLWRDGEVWRARPVDGSGESGFRFTAPQRVSGDIRIDTGEP